MAKNIIWTPATTFSEFSLLPDSLTTEGCTIDKIILETNLAGIKAKIPLFSAAMMSVTGYEMVLSLGRRGGVGVLPNKLPVEEQAGIVKKAKSCEMEFVEDPIIAYDSETIRAVVEKLEQHGHSTIPVVDKYRKFLGMFTQERYWNMGKGLDELVTSVMIPFNKGTSQIGYSENPNLTVGEVKKIFRDNDKKYLVVIDSLGRLVKLAFKQDIEDIKVGAAISTHKGWQDRVAANIEAGVNLIVIDTSDGYNEFAGNLIRDYKSNSAFEGVPICGGNVVTYDGAMYLMEAGADIVKLGMSSGSICTTKREKAVGRAPMAALVDCDNARKAFLKKTGRYVPLVWDGGAASAADFIIALTIADAVMAGGYFNHFYEAAGEKYDAKGKQTQDETKMAFVATWGEGSERARNYERYSQSRRTFFTEGEEGRTEYWGRLKPILEKDLNKIKAALSNAGSRNLDEFREKAVIELMSPASQGIVGDIHNMQLYKH
ncbi:IMP dehydrogenase [Candidatus Woesearchaeota archaeon]|nr:IMP dehydrogenase [Candidatus Woesearchaeota archaeon]